MGGSVVAGQAQITTAGGTTLINQSSAKAIINWQDFSVAKGAAVQFNQPNSSSLTLNRVTGTGISAINGSLTANGQVWLLNPNGLLIGNGAQINVGGLLATTSDLANQDFLAGRYNFSGGGSGAIVNNGAIKAAPGGAVVLSAPRVVNNGIIAARAGHVVLAGTDTFTVDFDGDHLISYAVGDTKKSGNGRQYRRHQGGQCSFDRQGRPGRAGRGGQQHRHGRGPFSAGREWRDRAGSRWRRRDRQRHAGRHGQEGWRDRRHGEGAGHPGRYRRWRED